MVTDEFVVNAQKAPKARLMDNLGVLFGVVQYNTEHL